MDITQLRKEYAKATLDETSVPSSPFTLFKKWFDEAVEAEVLEPNAMVLSTVDEKNMPFQRTVLMKKFDDEGLVFFTNYESRKATHIERNNACSVLFPWYPLERQVMVTGKAEKISKTESLNYFVTRPFGSQLGAWVSEQSKVITSRSLLETQLEKMKAKFKEGKVPLPDFWGGFRIIPTSFEFWQGRPNRLHDRLLFEIKDNDWSVQRLSP